ncbi:Gfo/Idh/MocA family oxidoreductase [Streptomyces rugosispiralis]|uniref:Gfo/Idh/MocA family oxidoreductase n=1 Tax=Streptomyces rugosispiralis TaxID=2967341 RepID=A0ABT1V3S2_9ACTN|nr:Gfo/Idh/MocA family oxidoreductase [Streptomyces rugosispiralis]MCQ8191206.1 Gfo/Idh/MocA family oxidoreductase [Streptomyces rugosispiralis]
MRIGIMGLGRIGGFHAETLSTLDAVDSLVVTDPVAAAATAAAERFGAQAVDSPEAVLATGVDGVVIAAATDAHPELILAAVRAGVPVFCEKPVARTIGESLDVLRAVEGSGVAVQIGYNRRFDPGYLAARAAVVGGELGPLHTVRSTTLDPEPPPAAYVAVSGGIFRDCAVHDFDTVRWITGREVTEVYATGSRGEATAMNFVQPHLDDRIVVRTPAGERTEELGRRSSYTYQLDAYAAHLRHGTPLPLDAEDALTAMSLIDACYRAAGFPPRPRTALPVSG